MTPSFEKRFPEIAFFLSLSAKEPIDLTKEPIDLSIDSKILYLFGVELALTPWELIAWLDKAEDRVIAVIEKDFNFLAAFSERIDLAPLWNHRRFHLFALPLYGEKKLAAHLAALFPTQKIEFLTSKRGGSAFFEKELLIESLLALSERSQKLLTPLLTLETLEKLPYFEKAHSLLSCRNLFKGETLIFCGAGPSLKKALPTLKLLAPYGHIIGLGSGCAALLSMGITPDAAIFCDRQSEQANALLPFGPLSFPLIVTPQANKRLFDLFIGEKLIFPLAATPLESLIFGKKRAQAAAKIFGNERKNHSVTTLAATLVSFFGAKRVIFVGVDLAMVENLRYAHSEKNFTSEGFFHPKSFDVDGLSSFAHWIMEKEALELIIKKTKKTSWINLSAGLKIDGTKKLQKAPSKEKNLLEWGGAPFYDPALFKKLQRAKNSLSKLLPLAKKIPPDLWEILFSKNSAFKISALPLASSPPFWVESESKDCYETTFLLDYLTHLEEALKKITRSPCLF